jgi:hypothetical protein
MPDGNFRKRDPGFAHQARYNPKQTTTTTKRLGGEDLTADEATQGSRGPNGARVRRKAREPRVRHRVYREDAADEQDCQACRFRATGLSQKRTTGNPWGIPVDAPVTTPQSRGQPMLAKRGTPDGRRQYRRRLAIVEPVFGNLRTQKGLEHVTLRGKEHVDLPWLLSARVHPSEKIAHDGAAA